MRIARTLVTATLLVAVAVPVGAGVPCVEIGGLSDRCPEWETQVNVSGDLGDWMHDIALSPDGTLLYMTLESNSDPNEPGWSDILTIALDSESGAQRWSARHDGPNDFGSDAPATVEVSPDGSQVFVAGWESSLSGQSDAVTLAYDAATGEERWAWSWDSGKGTDGGVLLAVGSHPDPEREGLVVYTAVSAGDFPDPHVELFASDAATGEKLWQRALDRPQGVAWDSPIDMELAGDGATLHLAMASRTASLDYRAVAIDTIDGGGLWQATYDGPAEGADEPLDLALSPDGSIVAVTGSSMDDTGHTNYATLAYDAGSGVPLWTARWIGTGPPPPIPDRYSDPGTNLQVRFSSNGDVATALAFSPNGSRLFVTGGGRNFPVGDDYTTVAYDVADGSEVWTARYDGPMHRFDVAQDLAVSPDGSLVYVVGNSSNTGVRQWDFATTTWGYVFDDFATVAYEADSGDPVWVGRYDGQGANTDLATWVQPNPATGQVLVGGNTSYRETPVLGLRSMHGTVVAYEA